MATEGAAQAGRGKAYITGASGKIGRTVFECIDAIPLVRKPSGLRGEIVTDFSEAQLQRILANARAIIHIAGIVEAFDKKKLREANVELTRRIAASAPPGCRIIFASSISVYGKRPVSLPANESTPPAPDSEYSRSKREAEIIVAARPNHVILRIGTVYGPGFSDYFSILRKIEKGSMRIIGRGDNRIPFVHVDDIAPVFRLAISRGHGTYVLAGEGLAQERIFSIAADELGVPAPKGRIGLGLAMLIAGAGELWCRISGKPPALSREHVAVLAYDRAFDCKKARRELGFSPRPLEQGIRDMARMHRMRKTAPNGASGQE
ncbi:NAD-dependent epimerase/dehydratase family protein [Candidatus Micrarchaeota archaeon]|nr:NAD-dependent epimerase/dehydratase family protein [Candidatus Micrarchaeota archaeon]